MTPSVEVQAILEDNTIIANIHDQADFENICRPSDP